MRRPTNAEHGERTTVRSDARARAGHVISQLATNAWRAEQRFIVLLSEAPLSPLTRLPYLLGEIFGGGHSGTVSVTHVARIARGPIRCRGCKGTIGRYLAAGGPLRWDIVTVGISLALRSAPPAGGAAAAAAVCGTHGLDDALEAYVSAMRETQVPEMDANKRLCALFFRHTGIVHAAMTTSPRWRAFVKSCLSEPPRSSMADRVPVRAVLSVLGGESG
jgi:hypothetical protein